MPPETQPHQQLYCVLGENSAHSSNEQILLNVRGSVQTHNQLGKGEIQ